MMRGETGISRAIQDALTSLGFLVIRIQAGRIRGQGGWVHMAEAGVPDLLVVGLGFLEVKQPKKQPSDVQLRWHVKARAAGARVAVVTSVPEAVEICRRWKHEHECSTWDELGLGG